MRVRAEGAEPGEPAGFGGDAGELATAGAGTGPAAEAVAASATGVTELAVVEGRAGLSLLESVRREASGTSGPNDRDVVIEYLAEGKHRPQLTLLRGQHKFVLCPGDTDQLYDLEADPDELVNNAEDPEYTEVADRMRTEFERRYDLGELESVVLASQDRRRLVAGALQSGQSRPGDYAPDPQQRCVRGDFWGALSYGQVKDGSRQASHRTPMHDPRNFACPRRNGYHYSEATKLMWAHSVHAGSLQTPGLRSRLR